MAQDSNIHDDIAFMRGLAEDGRRGPVLGGSILVACGLIYSIAAVFSWAFWAKVIPFERPVSGFEWWVAGVVQAVVTTWMIIRLRGAGRPTGNSRLFGNIWMICGFSIFAIGGGILLMQLKFGHDIVWACMPLAVLSLYGAGWAINAMIVKRPWMYGASAVSFIAAVLTAFLISTPLGMLGYAAAIFLTICVPGLMLMRETSLDESPA